MVSSKKELHCSVLRVRTFIRKSGDNSEEVTPVPISNTVVKLLSADDTWREAAWESRTLPVLLKKRVHFDELVFFSAAYKTGHSKVPRAKALHFLNSTYIDSAMQSSC